MIKVPIKTKLRFKLHKYTGGKALLGPLGVTAILRNNIRSMKHTQM